MSSNPEEPETTVDVEEGDVAENPTPPHDGADEPAHTAEDAEDDPPLSADEGDPSTDSFPAEGSAPQH